MSESTDIHHQINPSDIAIVGLAGRFPKAQHIDIFWQNLCQGVEAITFFSDQEVVRSGAAPALLEHANHVRAGGVLEAIECFDAPFFGFSPREAEVMDPQHRLFLETAWTALEHAGYDSAGYDGAIGIYAGVSSSGYLLNNLLSNPRLVELVGPLHLRISNDKDFLTTLVAYKMGLRGPSITVQTACSTSLVATGLACQGLLNYQCDLALAGGASIKVPHRSGYLYQEGGVLSPDGHCRAFDAAARGSTEGNGVGVVVLKRLADAVADGDTIHAVIKGAAINNDGSVKVSYTAPNVDGQAEVIAMAQAVAGAEPDTITYIETHGAGTTLGDPIEIAALTQVFRAGTTARHFCAIGSVKTNIGHLDAAAGVAGLIKTVLALKHKVLPPSLNFQAPNPQIDFANSPFYVNARLAEWKTDRLPRRAGVSSFGVGGANAHVVLEEAPATARFESARDWQLLLLSAKTGAALATATANLAEHLRSHPETPIADVAYTLQIGRRAFQHRRMLVCSADHADAIAALAACDPERVLTSIQETHDRPIAFMFPGLGDQYVTMALGLYQSEPIFRKHLDHCAELLKPHLQRDIRDVLYPDHQDRQAGRYVGTESADLPAPAKPGSPTSASAGGLIAEHHRRIDVRSIISAYREQASAQAQPLDQTALAQPIVFAIEYALAKLWMAWGIHPQALIGYSLGEYVAACLAGVFSLEDALLLVARRAQLIESLPGGAMLSVLLPEERARALLNPQLSLAGSNGPSVSVIAGSTDAIGELERRLSDDGVACRRIQTTHAFHSWMMEPIVDSFTRLIKTLSLNPPRIAYVSNVTGTWITPDQALSPAYWAQHLCGTVRFAEGIQELWKDPQRILIEVGPGQSLSSLATQHPRPDEAVDRVVLPSLRAFQDRQPDQAFILASLGKLWLAGAPIDWAGFYARERRQRVPLPTYPFERHRYWVEPPGVGEPGQAAPSKKAQVAGWFYTPIWKQAALRRPPLADKAAESPQRWLIFVDPGGIGARIARRLEHAGQHVVTVRAGAHFSRQAERDYVVAPDSYADYNALFGELFDQDRMPERIVHVWNVTPGDYAQAEDASVLQGDGFAGLMCLMRLLEQRSMPDPLDIWVVSTGLHDLESADQPDPEKAIILAPARILSREYASVTCRSLDITIPEAEERRARLLDQLMAELSAPSSEALVAYRGNHRWAQTVEAVRMAENAVQATRLREDGGYLIAGDSETAILRMAEYLARNVRARLALATLPAQHARDGWGSEPATHDRPESVSRVLQSMQAIEQLGSTILLLPSQADQAGDLRPLLARANDHLGRIDGVIFATMDEAAASPDPATEIEPGDWLRRVQAWRHRLYALEQALREYEPDFCLFLSSTAALLGETGVLDATATAAFIDAFVYRHNLSQAVRWTHIGWDLPPLADGERAEALATAPITPEEGAQTLRYILADDSPPRLIVSPVDFQLRGREQSASLQDDQPVPGASPGLYARANVRNAYVAPTNAIEQTIAAIWQELLGVEPIGIHDNFFELGGHSLLAIQLLSELRKTCAVELPLDSLFEAPTIARLAQTIAVVQQGDAPAQFVEQPIDLHAEAVLDLLIDAAGVPIADAAEPAAICLTGATGFLGAYLLAELLRRSRAEIHCLVRAPTREEARLRIQRNLETHLLWDEALADRIIAVPGDLTQPLWGLSEQAFHELAGKVDSVYHCGAWVNFTFPYSALRAANVLSTQEALRLACCVKVKPLHYISSMTVFSPIGYVEEGIIKEDNELVHTDGFFSGYAETKWVSEELITAARARGVPIAVYRPGVIGGNSRTGIGNAKDLVWNLIKGCIQLGMVPDIDKIPYFDTVISIVPVDYLSKAIVHLSRKPASLGKAFHFPNPRPMHWTEIARFIRAYGYPLRQVSPEEWQEVLDTIVANTPDNALHPFMPLFSQTGWRSERIAVRQVARYTRNVQLDWTNTLGGLADLPLDYPPVDDGLLATYFAYFIRTGFLDTPQPREERAYGSVEG